MTIKQHPTQETLKRLFYYNPYNGLFIRKINSGSNGKKGALVGNIDSKGYIEMCVGNKSYRAHRLAWIYVYGFNSENSLDHIDRNKCNNRIDNLREASQQCNVRNRSIQKNNKSGVTGLFWFGKTKRWRAQIKVDNKHIYLGYFLEKVDAVKARLIAEIKYGFPNCQSSSSSYIYLKDRGFL